MGSTKVEVGVHTQEDTGQKLVALILPDMPLAVKSGDKPVTALGLSAEEARVLARVLLEKASELEAE